MRMLSARCTFGLNDDGGLFQQGVADALRLAVGFCGGDENVVLEIPFDQLLFLVTTLHKLILGSRPFWNVGDADLKASAIAYPHPSILRYLVPVLYGKPDRNLPEPDFMSFTGEEIGLSTTSSVVIDGEMFEAPATGEIKISAGPAFEYLCG